MDGMSIERNDSTQGRVSDHISVLWDIMPVLMVQQGSSVQYPGYTGVRFWCRIFLQNPTWCKID